MKNGVNEPAAEPATVEDPRVRYVARSTRLVRGSSRRIMTMKAAPADPRISAWTKTSTPSRYRTYALRTASDGGGIAQVIKATREAPLTIAMSASRQLLEYVAGFHALTSRLQRSRAALAVEANESSGPRSAPKISQANAPSAAEPASPSRHAILRPQCASPSLS